MINFWIIIPLIFILLLGFTYTCSAHYNSVEAQRAEETLSTEMLVYHNSSQRIKFEYPKNWLLSQDTDKEILILSPESAVVSFQTVELNDNNSSYLLPSFILLKSSFYEEIFNNFTILENSIVNSSQNTLAGRLLFSVADMKYRVDNATDTSYSPRGLPSQQRLIVDEVFTIVDDKVYEMILAVDEDEYDKYLPLYKKIVVSLTLN